MKTDSFTVEILADGTLKIETDKISAANHANCTAFLVETAKIAGGQHTTSRKARVTQTTVNTTTKATT